MIFALGIASCSELRTAAMFSLNSSFGTPPGEAETWSFEPRLSVMAKTSCRGADYSAELATARGYPRLPEIARDCTCRLIEPRISLSDARSSL